jgi:hypothetical protein
MLAARTREASLVNSGERTVTRKIETQYQPTPMPNRNFDWMATWDNYDGMGSPIGFGATEREAIAELVAETHAREAWHKARH